MVSDSIIRWCVRILWILSLTACSTEPVRQDVSYSRTAGRALYELSLWSLEGRLALTGVNDSWSADVDWQHRPGLEEIKLSGPLGQGAVAIRYSRDRVIVSRGDDDTQTSDRPEEFINQQLGMFVPVGSLRYWVVGLPRPDQAFDDVENGFVQAGWQVSYPKMQWTSGAVMPRKIVVENAQVKLKLLIDQWIINGNKTR